MEVTVGQRVYCLDLDDSARSAFGKVTQVDMVADEAEVLMENGTREWYMLVDLFKPEKRKYVAKRWERRSYMVTLHVDAVCKEDAGQQIDNGDGVIIEDEYLELQDHECESIELTPEEQEKDERIHEIATRSEE